MKNICLLEKNFSKSDHFCLCSLKIVVKSKGTQYQSRIVTIMKQRCKKERMVGKSSVKR